MYHVHQVYMAYGDQYFGQILLFPIYVRMLYLVLKYTQKTRDVELLLVSCLASIADNGPASGQHVLSAGFPPSGHRYTPRVAS